MTTHSTGSVIRGWRRNYVGDNIVEFDGHPIFHTVDFESACASVLAALIKHPKTVIALTFASESNEPLRDPGCAH
jgi:hypothetical protein